jgi:hypothetical protein
MYIAQPEVPISNWDGYLRAMCREPVAALPAAHLIDAAAPVELRSALAEAKRWRFAQLKADVSSGRLDDQVLHWPAASSFHADRQGIRRKLNRQFTALDAP